MRGPCRWPRRWRCPWSSTGEPTSRTGTLIIFCAFSVIVGTLLIQGLSLPPLIRLLGVDDADETLEREENIARKRAARRRSIGSRS